MTPTGCPPPPYHLEKSAARGVAKRLVRQVVNRSPRLESMAFGGCVRIAERRVDCHLSASGRSRTEKVSCRYRVAVRARNRHPVGRIVARRCHTRKLRLLTYARAKAAMKPKATEIAGEPTSLELTRLSRLMFLGYAEWGRRAAAGGFERCALEMTAELLPSDEVGVEASEALCEPS